jgi:post-segregation antitoxin (ccd killing protein)
MSIAITLELPENLAEEARQLGVLTSETITKLLQEEVERRKIALDEENEAAWEERVVTEALGDALNPDGSIDFDKLRSTGIIITLEELYPEGDEENEP